MSREVRSDPVATLGEVVMDTAQFGGLTAAIGDIVTRLNAVSPDVEFLAQLDHDGDIRLFCRPSVPRPPGHPWNESLVAAAEEVRYASEPRPEPRPGLSGSEMGEGYRISIGYMRLSGPSFQSDGRTTEIYGQEDLEAAIATSIHRNREFIQRIVAMSQVHRQLSPQVVVEGTPQPSLTGDVGETSVEW